MTRLGPLGQLGRLGGLGRGGGRGGVPVRQPAGATLLEARGLAVDLAQRRILDGVELTVRAGEVVALVGPNGAGKTTLLRALCGELPASAGTVVLAGLDPGAGLAGPSALEQARVRAVLGQRCEQAFPFTVDEVVRMGRAPWWDVTTAAEDDELVEAALERCGLVDLRARPVPALSGGERARVSLARVLAQGAQLLMLDEPTAALDVRHQEVVFSLLRERATRDDGVVVVVHDLAAAAAHADRVVIVHGGGIVAEGPPDQALEPGLLEAVYGHPLEVFTSPHTGAVAVLPRSRPQTDSGFRTRSPFPSPTHLPRSTMTTPASTDIASAPSFTEALRTATWADHQRAEHAPFMAALMAGELPVDHYAAMVDQHLHIYRALDGAMEACSGDPAVAAFHDPALERVQAIEADLAHLWGPGWEERSRPLPATMAYCERIAEVAAGWPGGLVAHHYTRYLGDLSGGQFIGRMLPRMYALGDDGWSFYRFDQIEDPRAYKNDYRARLDRVGWDHHEQARVIEEIGVAYAHNIAVFDDLAASLP